MKNHVRGLARVLTAGVVASTVAIAAAVTTVAPAAHADVVTDPADGVPRTDPPPVYDRYPAILDPGAGSPDYFQPFWYDTQGRHIQAHGGQIVTVQENGEDVSYWYGEDRTNGYYGSPGVSVYRSTDTMNWENLGTALRGISDPAELTADPYFVDLYGTLDTGGQPKTDLVDSLSYFLNTTETYGYTAIFERPKVLYNAANDQWVMWWHADGRTSAGGSMYARSMAAVAVSDSPTGPFRMTGAYRMPNRSNHQACTTSAVPGQARDMTVFQDADGTAYIVYSSEENRSLYIAKLNDDYTNVEKTTTTDAVRSGTFESGSYLSQYSESGQYPYLFADGGAGAPVRGEDFQIVKECGMLEAPALFAHGGRYYVVASGATGWAPNPQTYHSADSILGMWVRGVKAGDAHENVAYSSVPEGGDGLLSWGDSHRTSFGSQSTNVLTLGPGRYVYMGDRWNSGASDSTYVWLPITIGEGGALEMRNPAVEDPARWGSGWDASYWDDKGVGEGIWTVVDTEIPAAAPRGSAPGDVLPATVAVDTNGVISEVSVQWQASFDELGRTTATGTLAAGDGFGEGRRFTRTVDVWEYGVANLARSSTVTTSSRSSLASTLVDGDVEGKGWDDWLSGGVYPQDSWLAFTWPAAQRADEVVVHTYQDGSSATWPSHVAVQYRDGGGTWVDTQIGTTLDQSPGATAPVATLDVSSLPESTGLRVLLHTDTNVWQSISEVQIFGDAPAAGNLCGLAGSAVSASFHQTEWATMPPALACDGAAATSWSTWSGSSSPAEVTFTVTAATAYDVDEVAFTNIEGSPQSVSVSYLGTDGLWHETTAQDAALAANGTQTTVGFDRVSAVAVRLTFATPGTYVKISELAIPATLSAAPSAEIEASVTTRCVAGRVVVVASVKNGAGEPVTVTVRSTFGSKTVANLPQGKTASTAFATRQTQVDSGTVEVTASAGDATSTRTVAFSAAGCG